MKKALKQQLRVACVYCAKVVILQRITNVLFIFFNFYFFTMKSIIFLFAISLFANMLSAQSSDEMRDVKQQVNSAFNNWSSRWAIDSYSDGSSDISGIGASDNRNYQYAASGSCTFSRGWRQVRMRLQFVAYLSKTSNGYRVEKLCYYDNSIGDNDCYNP